MARLLSWILVASMIVIAISASTVEEESDNEEIVEMESLSEAYAEPKARRHRKKKKKAKRVKKGKRNKKAKKGKKSKIGKKQKKQRGQLKSKCNRHSKSVTECLANLVGAMQFEGSIVTNFIAQKNRAINWNKLVENKKAKSANFANATASMLEALGGNTDAPTCSVTTARLTRSSAADAISNFNTLKNCSVNIEAQCDVENGTVDATALEACEAELKAIKTKNSECCKLEDEKKCECFADAMALVTAAKNGTCKQLAKQANTAMKKKKTTCLGGFQECKKAEDAAAGFINVCLGGTVPTASATQQSTAVTQASTNTGSASNSTTMGYECGTEVSSDCQSEYDNAENNNDLASFYKRCKQEGGANPLRDRCALCCQ